MYYTYLLIDSESNQIFYVGKGSGRRMYKHEKISLSEKNHQYKNRKLVNKIKSITSKGNFVIYEKIYEGDDEDLAYEIEEQKIDEIGLKNLCNLTRGGRGGRKGYKHTEENAEKARKNLELYARPNLAGRTNTVTGERLAQLQKQQKEILSHPDIRKKASEKQKGQIRENTSQKLKGRAKSDEHKEKLSKSASKRMENKDLRQRISEKVSESLHGNKRSARSICIQIRNENIIFESQKEAASYLGISQMLLSDMINNPNKKRRKNYDWKIIPISELE